MPYDSGELGRSELKRWEGDDWYLYGYKPKRGGPAITATQLILDFKNSNPEAVLIVTFTLMAALQSMESYLAKTCECKYIVSIPSSRQGGANEPAERVCDTLATRFDWLTHLPKALTRTQSVQKSATAYPGHRPDYTNHRATIQYTGPKHHLNGNFIMIDDVITRKVTSQACRDILIEASGCDRVIGLYVGRTI